MEAAGCTEWVPFFPPVVSTDVGRHSAEPVDEVDGLRLSVALCPPVLAFSSAQAISSSMVASSSHLPQQRVSRRRRIARGVLAHPSLLLSLLPMGFTTSPGSRASANRCRPADTGLFRRRAGSGL